MTLGSSLIEAPTEASQRVVLSNHGQTKRHFDVLDGLRGIAAVSVMLYHYTTTSVGWFPQGYLAVDLFFLLSGFVIAFSYEQRLQSGLSPTQFMMRRIVRLYPMIVVASLLGVLAAYAKLTAQPVERDLTSLTGLLLSSLTLIPQLKATFLGKELFPLNVVLWTIFFELCANFVYCLFAFRLKSKYLIAIVMGSLGLLVCSGTLGGESIDDFLSGFPRVIMGFCAGVLLYRYRVTAPSKYWNYGFAALSAMVALTFWLPFTPQGALLIPLFSLFAVTVVAGAAASPSRLVSHLSRILGNISYPLYALHLPLHSFFAGIEKKLMLEKFIPGTALEILSSLGVIAASFIVLTFFDEPVRAWLTRQLFNKPNSSRRITNLATPTARPASPHGAYGRVSGSGTAPA